MMNRKLEEKRGGGGKTLQDDQIQGQLIRLQQILDESLNSQNVAENHEILENLNQNLGTKCAEIEQKNADLLNRLHIIEDCEKQFEISYHINHNDEGLELNMRNDHSSDLREEISKLNFEIQNLLIEREKIILLQEKNNFLSIEHQDLFESVKTMVSTGSSRETKANAIQITNFNKNNLQQYSSSEKEKKKTSIHSITPTRCNLNKLVQSHTTQIPQLNSKHIHQLNSTPIPQTNQIQTSLLNSTQIPLLNSVQIPQSNSTPPLLNSMQIPQSNSTPPLLNSIQIPQSNSTPPLLNSIQIPQSNSNPVPQFVSNQIPQSNSNPIPQFVSNQIPQQNHRLQYEQKGNGINAKEKKDQLIQSTDYCPSVEEQESNAKRLNWGEYVSATKQKKQPMSEKVISLIDQLQAKMNQRSSSPSTTDHIPQDSATQLLNNVLDSKLQQLKIFLSQHQDISVLQYNNQAHQFSQLYQQKQEESSITQHKNIIISQFNNDH